VVTHFEGIVTLLESGSFKGTFANHRKTRHHASQKRACNRAGGTTAGMKVRLESMSENDIRQKERVDLPQARGEAVTAKDEVTVKEIVMPAIIPHRAGDTDAGGEGGADPHDSHGYDPEHGIVIQRPAIRKNDHEVVLVETQEIDGRVLLDARVWRTKGDILQNRTRKGLCLRIETWEQVLPEIRHLLRYEKRRARREAVGGAPGGQAKRVKQRLTHE